MQVPPDDGQEATCEDPLQRSWPMTAWEEEVEEDGHVMVVIAESEKVPLMW